MGTGSGAGGGGSGGGGGSHIPVDVGAEEGDPDALPMAPPLPEVKGGVEPMDLAAVRRVGLLMAFMDAAEQGKLERAEPPAQRVEAKKAKSKAKKAGAPARKRKEGQDRVAGKDKKLVSTTTTTAAKRGPKPKSTPEPAGASVARKKQKLEAGQPAAVAPDKADAADEDAGGDAHAKISLGASHPFLGLTGKAGTTYTYVNIGPGEYYRGPSGKTDERNAALADIARINSGTPPQRGFGNYKWSAQREAVMRDASLEEIHMAATGCYYPGVVPDNKGQLFTVTMAVPGTGVGAVQLGNYKSLEAAVKASDAARYMLYGTDAAFHLRSSQDLFRGVDDAQGEERAEAVFKTSTNKNSAGQKMDTLRDRRTAAVKQHADKVKERENEQLLVDKYKPLVEECEQQLPGVPVKDHEILTGSGFQSLAGFLGLAAAKNSNLQAVVASQEAGQWRLGHVPVNSTNVLRSTSETVLHIKSTSRSVQRTYAKTGEQVYESDAASIDVRLSPGTQVLAQYATASWRERGAARRAEPALKAAFPKVLLGHANDTGNAGRVPVMTLTCSIPGGVAGGVVGASLDELPAYRLLRLQLDTPGKRLAFAKLKGFWDGDGTLSIGSRAVIFVTFKDHDADFLASAFSELGIALFATRKAAKPTNDKPGGYFKQVVELKLANDTKTAHCYAVYHEGFWQYMHGEYQGKYQVRSEYPEPAAPAPPGGFYSLAPPPANGLQPQQVHRERYLDYGINSKGDDSPPSAKWLHHWTWAFAAEMLQAYLWGLQLADGQSYRCFRGYYGGIIYTCSRRFRDELQLLALLAGYTATFVRQYDPGYTSHVAAHGLDVVSLMGMWAVLYASGKMTTQPLLNLRETVTGVANQDPLWCLALPGEEDKFVVVRTVLERDADGQVVKASRPVFIRAARLASGAPPSTA